MLDRELNSLCDAKVHNAVNTIIIMKSMFNYNMLPSLNTFPGDCRYF